MKPKKKLNQELREEALNLFYNKGYSSKKIGDIVGRSPRTIYRWLNQLEPMILTDQHISKYERQRTKKYSVQVFEEIKRMKLEIPARSATKIQAMLRNQKSSEIPSLSTIRKFLALEGLSGRKPAQRKGYIKFQRKYPNDLWQIDIAGVQSIEKVGKVYLLALLDDCSRYIPAAFYALDEKGRQVIELIRQGFLNCGRPRQILADNGKQFRNLIGELGTKYTKLLNLLDVEPIFAKPYHPQTKGKLERWFGTVVRSFLPEVRHKVKNLPEYTLKELNRDFQEWLKWYNFEKPHRSLPKSTNPADIYFNQEDRISRPMQLQVHWERWLGEFNSRKVTKYNEIKYKGHQFDVPSGYSGLRINLIEFDGTLEIYYHDQKLCAHPLPDFGQIIINKKEFRKISKAGVIKYKGSGYSIDYKLAGKKVEVRELNEGSILLIYFQNQLIKQIQKA